MPPEKTIVAVNLILQCILLITVIIAGYLAKIRHDLKLHCLILRIAGLLQIIAIAVIMLPAMLGYLRLGERGLIFNAAMIIHHTLGLAVIAVWIYINLIFQGVIKGFGEPKAAMRLAFILWIIVLLIGIYLYLITWVL